MADLQRSSHSESTMSVTPIDATFGAVIRDVDLANLDDETWDDIHAVFLKYSLLVFPGQHLTDQAQSAFAHRLGKLEKRANGRFSNQNNDGSMIRSDSGRFRLLRGNEGWHFDSTYMPLAAKAGILSALVIPPKGGETEFADMSAAWDVLEEETQHSLEGLSACHSLYYSQLKAGYIHKTDHAYGFHDKGAPLRPIIKKHPETGRKSIYAGRHAYGIPGMSTEESEELLSNLVENACQPPRTYKHPWNVGDLVLWDNRCLMHRARPYDTQFPRILRGSRVSGEPETELAPTFADAKADGFRPSTSNESVLDA